MYGVRRVFLIAKDLRRDCCGDTVAAAIEMSFVFIGCVQMEKGLWSDRAVRRIQVASQ